MADKGIIFSAPMVRALLDGRKTQTRRLATFIKPEGDCWHIRNGGGGMIGADDDAVQTYGVDYAPYAPGDRLYVRESCFAEERDEDGKDGIRFMADDAFIGIRDQPGAAVKWLKLLHYGCKKGAGPAGLRSKGIPSIHMPRWASRLWLDVTEVRVQRLQDISEADAIAEGIDEAAVIHFGAPSRAYAALWNSLHGAENDQSWEANPWIVAVSFDVHQGNIDG